MARNSGITYEPCTLVYTLLDENELPFEDFYLYIRGIHSFMVEKFIPNAEMGNVHVHLQYQASVANFQEKLGGLQPYVALTKLSNFVQESEYGRLEHLRRMYGLRTEEPTAQPRRRGTGRKAGPVFAARPAPYPKRSQPKKPVLIEIPDGETEQCTATYYNDQEKRAKSNFHIRDTQENQQQVSE